MSRVRVLTITPTHTAMLDGYCACGVLVRKAGPLVELADGSAEIRPATVTDATGQRHVCRTNPKEAA